MSTPQKEGIDTNEHDVVKIKQQGRSKYVVRDGSKKVLIDVFSASFQNKTLELLPPSWAMGKESGYEEG